MNDRAELKQSKTKRCADSGKINCMLFGSIEEEFAIHLLFLFFIEFHRVFITETDATISSVLINWKCDEYDLSQLFDTSYLNRFRYPMRSFA